MLRRRILYGAALLAAVLFQIFYWGYLAHFLLAAALSLPVLSLLLSLPAMLGCRVTVEPSASAVVRGEAACWRVRVEGNRALPLGRLTVRLRVRNALTGEETARRLVLTGAAPGGRFTVPAETGRCGRLECRAVRVRVCDHLGLFALRRRPDRAVLTVLPPRILPEPPQGLDQAVRSAAGPRPRPGGGPGEDYELRAYRPGDPLRMVHWKLSARQEELIVRETLEEGEAAVLFTFDHAGGPLRVERALEQVNALCLLVLERGQTVLVRWVHPVSGEERSFRVTDREELLAMLEAALADPAPKEGRSVLEHPDLTGGMDCPARHFHIAAGEEDGSWGTSAGRPARAGPDGKTVR